MGENCLTDDILSRNDLKSFSSPFASGRSNVEYVLAFEKENYADFLNPDMLKYEIFIEKTVPRNKKYVETVNHYNNSCTNGVEFTHHDVISDSDMAEKISKRCNRLLSFRNKELVFVYHNRYCPDTDFNLMASHFEELKKIYESRSNHVQVYVFTQRIVENAADRRTECREINGTKFYTFYTLNVWEGEDQDIFWARCDNDLIKVMIDDIIEHTK